MGSGVVADMSIEIIKEIMRRNLSHKNWGVEIINVAWKTCSKTEEERCIKAVEDKYKNIRQEMHEFLNNAPGQHTILFPLNWLAPENPNFLFRDIGGADDPYINEFNPRYNELAGEQYPITRGIPVLHTIGIILPGFSRQGCAEGTSNELQNSNNILGKWAREISTARKVALGICKCGTK
jgi:hypothetical protein